MVRCETHPSYVQVKDINLSKESPCGHGTVTCFSIYGGRSGSGEACNFAADPRAPPQDRLWVDTMLDDQVSYPSLVFFTQSALVLVMMFNVTTTVQGPLLIVAALTSLKTSRSG